MSASQADADQHIARAQRSFATLAQGKFANWKLDLLAHKPGHYRGGRSLLRATCPTTNASVIVKVYDRTGHAANTFAALSELYAATSLIVKALEVDSVENLVIMEDLGDRTLADQLEPEHRLQTTRDALAWLAQFHADTGIHQRPVAPWPMYKEKKKQYPHVPEQQQKHIETLDRELRRRFAPYEDKQMPNVTSFGDFKPENLCVTGSPSRIVGIDYLHQPPQPIEHDIAFWLAWMEPYIWSQKLRAGQRVQMHDADAHTHAAQQIFAGRLDPQLLEAYRYGFLIDKWVKLAMDGRALRLLQCVEVRLGLRATGARFRPSLRPLLKVLRRR